MGEHFKTLSAVMLILEKQIEGRKQILLQKRQNTGYMDGMWDCAASGHVEENESMKMAMKREAQEELGIQINIDDIKFASFSHKYTISTGVIYYNAYFSISNYDGKITIAEPEKCSDLKWFYIDELPEDLICDRKIAIQNYCNNIPYSEYGWDE